jgi:FkbM family methyltransferase
MTSSYHDLEDVLALDIGTLRGKRIAHWRDLMTATGRQLVVFGAGELGLRTLKGLIAEGIRPLAILDNRVTTLSPAIMGVPMLTPSEAAARLGLDILCLVAVFNTSGPRKQLKSLGFRHVAHALDAFAGLPGQFLPYVCLDNTDVIFQKAEQVRAAYNLMADEPSRRAFVAQLRHRLFLDFDVVRAPQTPEMKSSEYFPDDLYRYLDDEVLADCGAFRGDTISRFIEKRGLKFSLIYGLEPDQKNFEALQLYVAGTGAEMSSRIKTLPYGVGSRSEDLSFNGDGSVRSGSSALGTETIRVERLDDICRERAPSLIKMDIEGGELEALDGAQQLISANAPVLAICVYHASAHLWEIPLLAAALNPRYRLFLRAHAEDCWDVACYAVPQNRCLSLSF